MQERSEGNQFSEQFPAHQPSLDDIQPIHPIDLRENQPPQLNQREGSDAQANSKTKPTSPFVETLVQQRHTTINSAPLNPTTTIPLPQTAVAAPTIANAFLQPQSHTQILIRAEHGLLILLLSLIFFVRASNLAFNTLHLDEAIYVTVGQEALARDFSQGATRWMFGSYLYPVTAAVADRLGGVIGLRLLSALCLTVAAGFVYLTAQRLFGKLAGLWATFIFGLAGISISLGQHATYDALGVPLIAAAFYFAVAAIANPARQRTYLLLSGFTFSLSLLSKYIGVIGLPALLGFMAVLHLYKGRGLLDFITKISWWAFMLPMFVILGIYGAFYYQDLLVVVSGQFAQQSELRTTILYQIFQDLGLPMLLAVIGIVLLARKSIEKLATSHPVLLMMLWMLLPPLLVAVCLFPVYHFVAGNVRSIWKHDVYSLVFIAPLAGYALAEPIRYLRARLPNMPFYLRAATAVITAVGIFMYVGYGLHQNADFHNSWPNNQDVIRFMQGEHLTANSKVLSSSYAIYEYYLNDFGLSQRHNMWSNVWYTEYKNLTGVDAVHQAIQDCAYDMIVIDNFYMPDSPGTLDPLILNSGYVVKYVTSEKLSSNGTLTTRVYEPTCTRKS